MKADFSAPLLTPASLPAFVARWFLFLILACAAGYAVLAFSNPELLSVSVVDNHRVRPLDSEPYVLSTDAKTPQAIILNYRYLSWQNAVLVFDMTDACISRALVIPDGGVAKNYEPSDNTSLCGEVTLDFSSYFEPGINTVMLEITSYNPQKTEMYVAPKLFGIHPALTIACLCIFGTFALLLYILARVAGLDQPAAFILILGFACYAFLLHLRPNLLYSNDLTGHVAYIRYMLAKGLSHPYGYNGWEHFHPPLYYLLASRFFALTYKGGVIEPLTLVRILALFFYMTFLLFGLLTLNAVSAKKNAIYYVAVLLLVFWPIGPIVATRISNDIPVYAGWAVALYFLTRWMKEDRLGFLKLAFVFTGIAFMFKSSALMLVAVTATCMLLGFVYGKLHWRDLLQKRSLLAIGVMILGALENTGRYILLLMKGGDASDYLTEVVDEAHPTSYYTGFDLADYIANPAITFDREPSYLNYFLKTVLYNEHQLNGIRLLPGIINVLLLVMLFVTFIATAAVLARRKSGFFVLAPLILGCLIPPVGPFIFMLMKRYMFCQSFRFIVPTLIAFIALYMRTLELSETGIGEKLVRASGLCAGCLMVLASMLMNGWLYSHGYYL